MELAFLLEVCLILSKRWLKSLYDVIATLLHLEVTWV